MKRFLAVLLLAGCAASPSTTALDQVQRACGAGAPHVEVTLSGYVTRVQGVRRTRSGDHEGFRFVTSSCAVYRRPCASTELQVEDNTDITGPIPLKRGDAVTVRGQYECNDAVIHWTHRDPALHHLSGYIKVNGREYQ